MQNPGYSPIPLEGTTPASLGEAADRSWVMRIANKLNSVLQGKLNAVTQITLSPSATTTTVIDARLSAFSGIFLQPLTANAMTAMLTSPGVLVTSQQSGSLVLTHASDTNSDKTFNMLIIG